MIKIYCLKIKQSNKNKRGLTKRENISPRDQQHKGGTLKSSGSCPPHNHLSFGTVGLQTVESTTEAVLLSAGWLQ